MVPPAISRARTPCTPAMQAGKAILNKINARLGAGRSKENRLNMSRLVTAAVSASVSIVLVLPLLFLLLLDIYLTLLL